MYERLLSSHFKKAIEEFTKDYDAVRLSEIIDAYYKQKKSKEGFINWADKLIDSFGDIGQSSKLLKEYFRDYTAMAMQDALILIEIYNKVYEAPKLSRGRPRKESKTVKVSISIPADVNEARLNDPDVNFSELVSNLLRDYYDLD